MGVAIRFDPKFKMQMVFESLASGSRDTSIGQDSTSPDRLKESICDVEGWLNRKLHTGKCSRVLISQIARHNLALGEMNNGFRFYFEPYDIYSVIESLETNNDRGKPLRKGLRGLYHIHHSKTYFIAENASRRWNQKVKRAGTTEHEYLLKLIKETIIDLVKKGLPEHEAAERALKDIVYKELFAYALD